MTWAYEQYHLKPKMNQVFQEQPMDGTQSPKLPNRPSFNATIPNKYQLKPDPFGYKKVFKNNNNYILLNYVLTNYNQKKKNTNLVKSRLGSLKCLVRAVHLQLGPVQFDTFVNGSMICQLEPLLKCLIYKVKQWTIKLRFVL